MKNLQGDIIGITDTSGNIVAKYTYDSWGKLISIKDANDVDKTTDENFIGYINPLRYRGYYYDSETGLYYLNARYYDPEVGRFINADEILYDNYNLFSYCYNNPINFGDFDGKRIISLPHMKVICIATKTPQGLSANYNCLGWAMQKITGFYRHEQPNERTSDNERAAYIARQYILDNTNVEQVEIFNHLPNIQQLSTNQYLIAVRTSANGDAHFMRSDWKNGQLIWTHKPGDAGPLLELIGITPDDNEAWHQFDIDIIPGNFEDFRLITVTSEPPYTGSTYYLKVTLPKSSCIIA